jgi:hypothetical protein
MFVYRLESVPISFLQSWFYSLLSIHPIYSLSQLPNSSILFYSHIPSITDSSTYFLHTTHSREWMLKKESPIVTIHPFVSALEVWSPLLYSMFILSFWNSFPISYKLLALSTVWFPSSHFLPIFQYILFGIMCLFSISSHLSISLFLFSIFYPMPFLHLYSIYGLAIPLIF